MSDIGSTTKTQTLKNYITSTQQIISTTATSLYTEFSKHPTYYIGSGVMRLAIGAGVGYGMYYGLSTLAAPFIASAAAPLQTAAATTNQVISPIMKQLFGNIPNLTIPNMTAAIPQLPVTMQSSLSAFANIIPKAIAVVSGLGGLIASTKLSDMLLSSFFGEVKLKANINKEDPRKAYIENVSFSGNILKLFGQNRPYITPVNELAAQLEKEMKQEFKELPDLLPQSKMLAFAYTKQLVEANDSKLYTFDADAKATVKTEPYVSAAQKAGM